MKRFGREAFGLFFLVLLIACAFDGVHASVSSAPDSRDSASFCVIIHTFSALSAPPPSPPLQAYSDETVQPLSEFRAVWSLVHAIDHPPRLLGRTL